MEHLSLLSSAHFASWSSSSSASNRKSNHDNDHRSRNNEHKDTQSKTKPKRRTTAPGLYGEWPVYGGNLENHQRNPSSSRNKNQIQLKTKRSDFSECTYISETAFAYTGFITIDDDHNGYFADSSGFVTAIDLDTCRERWRVELRQLVGSADIVVARNSLTLYQNSAGVGSVLLGAPNGRQWQFPVWQQYSLDEQPYGFYEPCYAISLRASDGRVQYMTDLSDMTRLPPMAGYDLLAMNKYRSCQCNVHGFIVDGAYGYGGMSTLGNWHNWENPTAFQGRMMKINVDTGELVKVWFTFPDNGGDVSKNVYTGASAWNFPAIIDDYLVFGTANLASYPDYVGHCLLTGDTSVLTTEGVKYNACGNEPDHNWFKCLEKNVFVNSFMVLNKHTFEVVHGIPLLGVDAWAGDCFEGDANGRYPSCPVVFGPDTDVVAVAVFKKQMRGTRTQTKRYGVTTPKFGHFFMFDLDSGEVVIAKQLNAGDAYNTVWGIAVDPQRGIAVLSQPGRTGAQPPYTLADGTDICQTGVIHAIDLNTGYTLYQIVNPYGIFGADARAQCISSDAFVDLPHQMLGECSRDFEGNPMLPASATATVIYPPTSPLKYMPAEAHSRAIFLSPVTIAGDLLYIPSRTGDVFVHELESGEFVTRYECPNYVYNAIANTDPIAKQSVSESEQVYNRAGVGGGATVTDDRIVFFCGQFNFGDLPTNGDTVVSMVLKKTKQKHNYKGRRNANSAKNKKRKRDSKNKNRNGKKNSQRYRH